MAMAGITRWGALVSGVAAAAALATPVALPAPGAGATSTGRSGQVVTGPVAGGPAPGTPGPASSPPLPAGSRRGQAAAPQVYPGNGVAAFGDATVTGTPLAGVPLNAPVVALVDDPHGSGYWLAGADGGVYSVGGAPFYGSAGGLSLVGPVVGMAATPDGGGYWLVALDGGVFTYGDAGFYGSMGGHPLNRSIVGMAATPDGKGYWLVAADGGIFTFGDAGFYGSAAGQPLPGAVAGMAATPDGKGYWLVGDDGSVYPFGDATSYGTEAKTTLNAGIVAMAPTPDGKGYWLLGWDGGIFTFGDAGFYGSPVGATDAAPYTAIAPSPDGKGYRLLEPDGYAYSFANPPTVPGWGGVVASAASQVQPDPYTGWFCSPYGPCEEWCALFATWAWQQGGVPIPSYAFTGYIDSWAAAHGVVLPPTARPLPGDAVLYGTGPWTVTTSLHTGIVAQVWPDGAIDTIEGDAGPGTTGHLAVVVNGPFLPASSIWYNGMPIYAFAQP